MWSLTKKIISSGIQTEPLPTPENTIENLGNQLQKAIRKRFNRSLAIRMVDAGSCNGCELEIQATQNPLYALERFGVQFVASPRHADLLLVTGPVTHAMKTALWDTYAATPDPKLVVAIGDCGACGGVFKNSYAVVGSVSAVIPVNVVVHGCPPTPWQIIQGILTAVS